MKLFRIGVIGAEAAKFSPQAELETKFLIENILIEPMSVLVSGGCHLGGVDIWAEEIYNSMCHVRGTLIQPIIHKPAYLGWPAYKERNLKIAQSSDVLHVIVVDTYPDGYVGMRFPACYHCKSTNHIKSGACWTAKKALELGKPVFWYVVGQDGTLKASWGRSKK